MIDDDLGASLATGLAGPEGLEPPSRLPASRGIPSAAMRRVFTVYEKPKPARAILVNECGMTDEEAVNVMRALVKGGYGIAPREPTNGMLVGYLEALTPPNGYEQVITAISKARVRWQAMLAHGTEMALSRKFLAPPSGRAKGGHARAAAMTPEQRSEQAKKAAKARWSASADTRRMAETSSGSVRSTGGAVGEAETPNPSPEDRQPPVSEL